MVISDGAPVDDSSISCNNKNFLSDHLNEVIQNIEKESKIELIAIGIGHDVTKFYKKSLTIKEVEHLGDAMFEKLTEIF